MVAPEGREGGEGRTGTPFGGRVMGIVTGFDATGWEERAAGGGGAGGGVGWVAPLSMSKTCGGALDGGAA